MRANVGRSVPTVGIRPSGIKQHKLNGVHMKYTSLFSAVAIAAAMGTTALATVSTNNQVKIDFEGNSYPVGTMAAAQLTGWTVQTEDQSEIIAAPLSSADAVDGYTANKHLKLNTEGQELTWVPATYTEPKAIVEMKVRLVASDTAPAITDTDVHAAVYLQVDENNPSGDGLYAYGYNTNLSENGWIKLDTSSFNTNLETGAMVALRVLMDYNETARNVIYEGALLTGAENEVPTYFTLGTVKMANQGSAATQGKLASISFKGTGGVDDLFVGEIEETASTANVTLQLFQGGEWQDIEDGTVDTANAALSFTYSVEVPEGKVAVVTVLDDQENELATLENVIDSLGNLEVSCANYAFEAEEDYYIRVAFTDPVVNYTVSFTTAYGTAPAAQTVQSGGYATDPGTLTDPDGEYTFVAWQLNGVDYDFATTPVTASIELVAAWQAAVAPATGVEFGEFEIIDDGHAAFTAFSVNGTTATVTLSAKIQSTGAQTQKTLYAKYKTALGSSTYGYAEATVSGTPVAGDPSTITFTFTVPDGNSFFLVGLTNDDGSN